MLGAILPEGVGQEIGLVVGKDVMYVSVVGGAGGAVGHEGEEWLEGRGRRRLLVLLERIFELRVSLLVLLRLRLRLLLLLFVLLFVLELGGLLGGLLVGLRCHGWCGRGLRCVGRVRLFGVGLRTTHDDWLSCGLMWKSEAARL